jgi:hypothetical protein
MPKKTKDLSSRELADYSQEHLHYEIYMLLRIGELDILAIQNPPTQFLMNILVASFAIHLRNLITFLYPTTRVKETDVSANDFFAETQAWEKLCPPLSKTLIEARERANREVGHLTTYRIAGVQEEKTWNTGMLTNELRPILRRFCESADTKKLHSSVLALLK